MNKKRNKKPSIESKNTLCPFVESPPSEDCYCVKMDSLSTRAAIDFCANNYWDCEIFKSFKDLNVSYNHGTNQ